MSEFDLMNKAINMYDNLQQPQSNTTPPLNEHKCTLTVGKGGVSVCTKCGQQTEFKYTNQKEWSNFSPGDVNKDRTNIRRKIVKNIYKDLEGLNICNKVKEKANTIYCAVTGGSVYRGRSRKSIIFGCVFYAYKTNGTPQNPNDLLRVFSISRKLGLKGIKHISIEGPKHILKTDYSPEKLLIKSIMNIYSSSLSQIEDVYNIYDFVKDKSSQLNRARPKSLAVAIVWYWILKNKKNITINQYISKVNLSKITIKKLYTEIVNVYNE